MTPPSRSDQPTLEHRLRTKIEAWLAAHDPRTLDRLRRDPMGPEALNHAAAAIRKSLARAAVVMADPESADPSRGDEFYLKDHPEGLEQALVANLASDTDYWEATLRWLPRTGEPTEQTDPAVGPDS